MRRSGGRSSRTRGENGELIIDDGQSVSFSSPRVMFSGDVNQIVSCLNLRLSREDGSERGPLLPSF
jgi:hypothetical protein